MKSLHIFHLSKRTYDFSMEYLLTFHLPKPPQIPYYSFYIEGNTENFHLDMNRTESRLACIHDEIVMLCLLQELCLL